VDAWISPWIIQESFNTLCAASIVIVEESTNLLEDQVERNKFAHGVTDLLLYILTTPLSSVTILRGIGASLQALENLGIALFRDAVGTEFQNWIRIILSHMNSVSLAVRSIAVDFFVDLLSRTFNLIGNIAEVMLITTTILPEVVAREIGLYSVAGLIDTIESVSQCVWPIRRAFADIQEANPRDDERIDPQLVPELVFFCRTSQAIVDGVLIEITLKRDSVHIGGKPLCSSGIGLDLFCSDEESICEVAFAFHPETSPMQRIRWLLTLKNLHQTKGNWLEAAHALLACANTALDALPFLKCLWRPSQFELWSDNKRSKWLDTIGENEGIPERSNKEVIAFAESFLEPHSLLHNPVKVSVPGGRLRLPTFAEFCTFISSSTRDAAELYVKEGMADLAQIQVESMLRLVLNTLEKCTKVGTVTGSSISKHKQTEELSLLRKVVAIVSGQVAELAQETSPTENRMPAFVAVRMSGLKPSRFYDSTLMPPCFEWDSIYVCRVSKGILDKPCHDPAKSTKKMCLGYAQPFLQVLQTYQGTENVIVRTEVDEMEEIDPTKTYMFVTPVEYEELWPTVWPNQFVQHAETPTYNSTLMQFTVLHSLPCLVSRQRSVVTSEIQFHG
jgi:hypothetical protein